MANEQPDTFASVKKRWREEKSSSPERTENEWYEMALRRCAYELESGLEQRVRELRDLMKHPTVDGERCSEHSKAHEPLSCHRCKLTTMLGEPKP